MGRQIYLYEEGKKYNGNNNKILWIEHGAQMFTSQDNFFLVLLTLQSSI